jgi:hypothetical protein
MAISSIQVSRFACCRHYSFEFFYVPLEGVPGLVCEGIQSGCSGGRELSKAYQPLVVSAIRQDLLNVIEVGT